LLRHIIACKQSLLWLNRNLTLALKILIYATQ